jgi:dTDP-D-glucose 4,6-dehydratase
MWCSYPGKWKVRIFKSKLALVVKLLWCLWYHVYNLGGKNELPNVKLARQFLTTSELDKEEEKWITYYVPYRSFNDMCYTIKNSKKLHDLGWVEEMGWEEGLQLTVDWYKKYTSRHGNIDSSLVAHPTMLDGPGVDAEVVMGNLGSSC